MTKPITVEGQIRALWDSHTDYTETPDGDEPFLWEDELIKDLVKLVKKAQATAREERDREIKQNFLKAWHKTTGFDAILWKSNNKEIAITGLGLIEQTLNNKTDV